MRYVASREDALRPPSSFSVSSLARGASARVRGVSSGGWVFCGLLAAGCGQFLAVAGGAAKEVSGFSGDETEVEFELTHDGSAAEVVVTYSTRAD